MESFVVCPGGKAHARQHKAGCQAGGGHGYRNSLFQIPTMRLVKKVSVSEGGFPYRLQVKGRQMQREAERCADLTARVQTLWSIGENEGNHNNF